MFEKELPDCVWIVKNLPCQNHQNCRIDAVLLQKINTTYNALKRSFASPVYTISVVNILWPVQAYAYSRMMLFNEITPLLCNTGSVGLKSNNDRYFTYVTLLYELESFVVKTYWQGHWFACMPYNLDAIRNQR